MQRDRIRKLAPPCLPSNEDTTEPHDPCRHRAYLVATTRDHGRVEVGRGFYCTNPRRYEEAGEQLEKQLRGPAEEVEGKLRAAIRKVERTICGETRRPAPRDGIRVPANADTQGGRPLTAALSGLFRKLFCSGQDAPSLATETIAAAIQDRSPPDELASLPFEREARAFCSALETPGEPARARSTMSTLLRHTAALVMCDARGNDGSGREPDGHESAAIRAIIWELFRSHDLLTEYRKKVLNFESLQVRYRALGLSGWSAAFGKPINLCSIENPFEIRDYAGDLTTDDYPNGLPPPLWGDRARGHQDRLEREGRPFLCVPVRISQMNEVFRIRQKYDV